MQNKFKPLNQLAKDEIQELINACISFDAGNILGVEHKASEVTLYASPKFGWKWTTKEVFAQEIRALTGAGSIAQANKILEKQLTKAPEQPSATRPGKEELKTLEGQAKAREEAQAAAKEKGERQAREYIEQRQKIAEKLKSQAVYAKVEAPEPEKLTENEQKAYEEYKKAVKADPDKVKVVNELAEEIKTRVTPSLVEQGATPEEIEILSKQTAATLVEKMVEEDLPTYTPVTTQAAILSAVANDTKTVTKVVTDKAAEQVVHTAANNVGVFKIYPDQVARNITSIAFGERFTETIFGVFPNKIKVELSDIPSPSFTQAISFEQLDQVHTELQQNQNQTLNLIQGVGTSQAKKILLKQTGTFLEKRIASLPAESIAGKVLGTPEAQSLFFSTFGVGTAVRWETTNLVGGLVLKIAPESAPLLSAFGKLTGINLVKPAAAAVTKTAVTAGTKVAAGAVAKKGLAAVLPKLAALLGIVTTPLGSLLAWVGTELLVRAGSWLKKFVAEHKEDIAIAGLALFIFGVITRSIILMVSGGVFMFPIFIGGVTAAALGSRFLFLSGAFAKATVITIGKPILITLLVFPVVVALILFIINSGAFVVPPMPYDSPFWGKNLPVICSDEKGPVGVAGPSSSSPIANRAWKITYDLYQGFWCFWNRSPGNPPHPDFPNDVLTYPPGYPELFDYSLFRTNPNPGRNDGVNLFWCTWLPIKAYNENGIPIPENIYSPDMYNDFRSRGKIIEQIKTSPSNVQPGAVVFFDVDNSLNRIDHVGVIYSVNQDGATFVQSNAPTKDDLIPFGTNGLEDLPGIDVVAIGNP